MFLLTRRQTRTALAATAGAAAYLAASEIGARKLRLTGLWVLSSVAMAGVASISGTTKARAAHKRIDLLVPVVASAASDAAAAQTTANNALPKSGGTVTGSVTVDGDHHVHGTLYGVSGALGIGDTANMGANIQMFGNTLAMYNGNITGAGHLVAAQIGPGGSRAALNEQGSNPGTTYNQGWMQGCINIVNDCSARVDWLKGQLDNANINY